MKVHYIIRETSSESTLFQHRKPISGRTLYMYLERIMFDALEEHDGKVSIEEQELEALEENLDKTCPRYNMEISAEKTKLMTNSANDI